MKSRVGIRRDCVRDGVWAIVKVPGTKIEMRATAWVMAAKRTNHSIEARMEDLKRMEAVFRKLGEDVIRFTRASG